MDKRGQCADVFVVMVHEKDNVVKNFEQFVMKDRVQKVVVAKTTDAFFAKLYIYNMILI